MQQVRLCKKCLVEKKISNFYTGTYWCKPCHNTRSREAMLRYYHTDKGKEAMSIRHKAYMLLHKEERKEKNNAYARAYQSSEKGKAKRRIIDSRRRQNPDYRLHTNISRAVRTALNGNKNGKKWEELVGYTRNQLVEHLERQFDSKMNWENYGSYWHIDHKIPRSKFNQEQIKDCWALSNLRPLEAKYNMLKSDMFEVSHNNFIKFVSYK
jgi:hypothetical protein